MVSWKRAVANALYIILLALVLGLPLDSYLKAGLIFLGIALVVVSPLDWKVAPFIKGACLVVGIVALKSLVPQQFIQEGGNVFVPDAGPMRALPEPIYDFLDAGFKNRYPQHSLIPDTDVYAFSAEKLHQRSPLSRAKRAVDFNSIHELGFGAFNRNNFNTYGPRVPHRDVLPYFMRYELSSAMAQDSRTKVCWRGDLFVPVKKTYRHLYHPTKSCSSLAPAGHFYGVNIDPNAPLQLRIEVPFAHSWGGVLLNLLTVCGAFVFFLLFFQPRNLYRRLRESGIVKRRLILLGLSLIVTTLVTLFYRPQAITGFILFEGGNDGLTYATAARTILKALYEGNWHVVFQGNEDVYMLMPWHRYFYALNLFLFGETHFGYMMVVMLFPLVIYRLANAFFGSGGPAFWLSLSFVAVPIFESFGFAQFYMARLCLRGFSEPLSYFFFFLGLSFAPYMIKNVKETNGFTVFVAALVLCFAVGIRPNLVPGAFVFLAWTAFCFLGARQLKQFIFLGLGFLPILLIPLHNYYFGHVFVPLTASATIPENLAIEPKVYGDLLRGLLSLQLPAPAIKTIFRHITGEVSPKSPWLYLSAIVAVGALLSKKCPKATRLMAAVGLAQFSLTFLYHVGGRYGYAHWICLLLATLLYFVRMAENREFMGSGLKKRKK